MLSALVIAIASIELHAKTPAKIKNLQRVTFFNKTDGDVAMTLRWDVNKGSKRWTFGFSSEEEHILKSHHKDNVFVAPFSEYHLGSVVVTPAANLAGKDLAQLAINSASFTNEFMGNQTEEERRRNRQLTAAASGATDIAYAISESLNKDHLDNLSQHKTFFVVEYSREKSLMPGQKKIRVKDYRDRAHYDQEIAREGGKNTGIVPPAKLDKKMAAPVNDQQESSVDAELRQLELEERRLALQEKRLALQQKELALANQRAAKIDNESISTTVEPIVSVAVEPIVDDMSDAQVAGE